MAYDSGFNKSLDTGNNNKKINGNSYLYTLSFGSVFGFGTNTTINVTNGIIVSRTYEAYTYNDSGKEITENWIEGENELGLHEEGVLTFLKIAKMTVVWVSILVQ